MLKTYRIIPLVFILCLFGLTLMTVSPVFAADSAAFKQCQQIKPQGKFGPMKQKKNCFKNLAGPRSSAEFGECRKIKPQRKFIPMKQKKNCFRDLARSLQPGAKNEEIMKGFRHNIEQGLHNVAAAQDALRKNNKGIKDDKIWFCEQFTGCRWGSRCANVRIGGGYPIGLVSPADAKRIDGQYLNQCGEGLYAWATQPHGGNAYMQATCKTWGRCDDAELEIDLAAGKRPTDPCASAQNNSGSSIIDEVSNGTQDLVTSVFVSDEDCSDYKATDYGRDDSVDMAEKQYLYKGSCHGDPRCVYWCNKNKHSWLDKQGVCKPHEGGRAGIFKFID